MNNQLHPHFSKLKPYLLLLVILLLAYLPVSTFHFGLKNDAFSDNFPNKFFLTQALRSGFLPLWNPYLNFGFPVYADPGFAFWNPITWFFGAIIGYNAYTLTLEVLLYIYLAGVCMYRLGRYVDFTVTTAVAVAVMYMCSGFFTGELQHINFLTSAAFLPFLIHRFLALSKNPGYRNTCLTAIAYYMVVAGGHPAIPIATVYFLFTFSLSFFIFSNQARQNWRPLLWYHSLSVLIFIILYSPAIYSYVTIAAEYGRGTPANQLDKGAMQTGFSFSSYLSFLYPFATTKNASFLTDDLAMRNGYFSVAGFILVLTQLKNKTRLVRTLIICGIVMLVLSAGGYVKPVVFTHLPFLNFIRTNGEFRVFTILCLCVIAGYALNSIKSNRKETPLLFTKVLGIMLVINVVVLCIVTARNFTDLIGLLTGRSTNEARGLKGFLDSMTFSNVLLISVIINLALTILLLAAKADVKRLSFIIILDLILNSILYLPFSGVGAVTLSIIQQTYDKSPHGITKPPLTDIKDIDTLPTKTTGLIGSWAFYNKKIGITRLQDYPSYFTTTDSYFNSDLPGLVNNLPYVFLKSGVFDDGNQRPGKRISVSFFSPQKIQIKVDIPENDSLILLQNHYRFWHVKVDGELTKVNRSLITFMSVPLNRGVHEIEFFYQDKWLFVFVTISIVAFMIVLVFIYPLGKVAKEKKNEQN